MDTSETLFYDPNAPKQVYHKHLPHWNQTGRMYFVTFRLADSLPRDKLNMLKQERQVWEKTHQPPYTALQWQEYHKLFSHRIEQWLDNGTGACLLADPRCANIVARALAHFDGERYRLDEWVIMPTHIHVLVTPNQTYELSKILHTWKSFTASAINKLKQQTGRIWQHESFDHIVRSPAQLERLRHYIRDNPTKAGLAPGTYRLK